MKKTAFVSVFLTLFGSHYCVQPDANDTCGGCLLLSPYIRRGETKTARLLSQVDPDPFFGIKSHSGFINVNEDHGSNMFFWFFPSKSQLEITPWIIWLQGGPGMSSMKGLFEINGPLNIVDGEVKLRNVTWASDYSIMFLDNPVGAGFSFTQAELGYTTNIEDVGSQMFVFLRQFLFMFPELQVAPLFIAGQSYAGKYVPALAIQIHRRRKTIPINLRGIAIGNGMVDPRNMMHYSRICNVLGILDDKEIEELRHLEESTVTLTDKGQMVDAANKFNETIEYIKKHSGVSVYNFLKDNIPGHSAPDFEIYVNRAYVRNLIHVGNVTFNFNNQVVYRKMLPDIMNSTKPFVEELLQHYGVMSYSGQLDIIMAYSLARDTFKTLYWPRRSAYVNAHRIRVVDDDGNIIAFKKSGGNFVDVLIRNAGHSVPSDQPQVAKYIIDSFIEEFK